MARVAVEPSLSSQIEEMLRNNGYDVVELGNWQQMVDAIVISGMDENILGDSSLSQSGAPVINADGMTPQEVFHEVHTRLSPTRHH
ncbi:YkuS family protein [Brevibacillus sp. TJ4]|uniref:YkuS family protein n=1 Tax=Brevibacillus sp. TJ4 TaxID=3234853 RepID=UPI0037D2AEB1